MWIPGAEHYHNVELDPRFHENDEIPFALADAVRRPGLVRQRTGDVITKQLRARPRVVRDADGSFIEREERGTIRMEDVTRG